MPLTIVLVFCLNPAHHNHLERIHTAQVLQLGMHLILAGLQVIKKSALSPMHPRQNRRLILSIIAQFLQQKSVMGICTLLINLQCK
jgi:hypothetical protein